MEITYSVRTFCLTIVKMYVCRNVQHVVGSMIRAYILRPWLCGQNKCKQEAKSSRHERSSEPQLHDKNVWKAVWRIRDILVRIRILGSIPLTNGSGSGSGRTKKCRSGSRTLVHKHHSTKIKSHKEVT